MTDLQASLIAIGGVILLGVVSYNRWQEHKARKSVEQAFPSAHDDVLMSDDAPDAPDALTSQAPLQRQEPQLPQSQPAAAPASANKYRQHNVEPTLEPYLPGDAATAAASAAQSAVSVEETQDPLPPVQASADQAAAQSIRPPLPVDELIDCTIPIALDAQAEGARLLPLLQKLPHVGNKRVSFIGRNAYTDDWESISAGSVYSALAAGVQLANRNSALNELEYSELVMRLHEITETIGAAPDVPDMVNVIRNAQALHRFIVEHDVQLSVNVRTNGSPWNVVTLLGALTRQGFDRRPDGSLVMQDGENEVLFMLATNSGGSENTDRLTLLLDVPRVGPARDGFGALVACARSLAMRLGGTMVDDGNQFLSDEALADIAQQVNAFYIAMDTAGIPAGSSRAIRLFA